MTTTDTTRGGILDELMEFGFAPCEDNANWFRHPGTGVLVCVDEDELQLTKFYRPGVIEWDVKFDAQNVPLELIAAAIKIAIES